MFSVGSRVFPAMFTLLLYAVSGAAQITHTEPPILPPVRNGLQPPTISSSEHNPYEIESGEDPHNELFKPFLFHLANDQKQFWLSPKQLSKPEALRTFIPFVGFTGLL